MVMSATYRQSSKLAPALIEADPGNRWLARGPRMRLSAEEIRDSALSISGLLVEKLGGKYLVRAGKNATREGAAPEGRLVILEFASFEAAQAFYDSPEYQAILPQRTENATSRIVIMEGYTP